MEIGIDIRKDIVTGKTIMRHSKQITEKIKQCVVDQFVLMMARKFLVSFDAAPRHV
jgi:hypothetical protein